MKVMVETSRTSRSRAEADLKTLLAQTQSLPLEKELSQPGQYL